MRELWPHQVEAFHALRQTVAQGVTRIVLSSPTGSGKTRLAAAIIDSALQKGKRVTFVVSNLSLIQQTMEAFYKEGIRDMGVIQGDHAMQDWSRPVQIASIQTLASRKVCPRSDLVIMDEIHVLYDFAKKWIKDPDWQKVPFIGLSATPGTRGLGKYFDTLLTVSTTAKLIEEGYLSKFRVFATGHPDLSGVKTVAGDYHEGELSQVMQSGGLTADIVQTWKQKWGKGKTLCFAVDCAHAQNIQERFQFAGIRCGYQDGRTPEAERREIKKKFHSGELEVVSNVGTLTTGTDWNVHCLILARPTKSEMLYQQIIGRCLRTAPDKDYALILDHSDTTRRLGFVTDIDWSELDDGKPNKKAEVKKKEPLPKECEKCTYLMPRALKICPSCGNEMKITSSIWEQDGELVELTGSKKAKAKKGKEWTMAEKGQFFSELKALGKQHGYKDGWAANQYRERIKAWPDWTIKDIAPAKIISPNTALWVRSRRIAYSKRKAMVTANG